ncbi:MAG: hypothetical protein M3Y41_21310 [Pseudomonadota bacterium]|nr:hypothetical protein [Pseudomonadota bacterium]
MDTTYFSPRSLRLAETDPARSRYGLFFRPLLRSLAFAVVVIVAVTGARLLGAYGVPAPLPCGDNLNAACAAP